MPESRHSRRDFALAGAAAAASGPSAFAMTKTSQLMNKHVVLLGDSVFANAAYVGGGPDVITQLRQRLPSTWRATLLAVDGSIMAAIPGQLERVPADASHLLLSIGRNDALGYSAVLAAPSRSVADGLEQLADVRERFQREYRGMFETLMQQGLPAAVCTIYDPATPSRCGGVSAPPRCASSTIVSSARPLSLAFQSLISVPYAARTPISPTRSSLPFRAAAR